MYYRLLRNTQRFWPGRGSVYQAHTGASGSLSRAWTTKTTVGAGFNLGTMETYYDSGKLAYDASIGQHITPNLDSEDNYRHVYSAGAISDMASLIIQGGGGMLFGPDNPTRTPSDFWTPLLQQVRPSLTPVTRSHLTTTPWWRN